MRKTYLFLSCLIACLALEASAKLPKLTVVIVADGLDAYSIERMRDDWSEGGLYTLVERSAVGQCSFPLSVYGGNETTATLLTGVLPSEHGYSMDHVFQASDHTAHLTLEDKRATGIGTTLRLSPRGLLAPTLTDHIRLHYGEYAQLYAIGLEPQATIIMAGHAANGCCWLDPQRLQWVTSSYYAKGLPSAADEVNTEGLIQQAVNNNKPKQLLPATANQQVIELALRLQESNRLGEDLVPDMLMLQLTTLPANAHSDRISSDEHEALYNRLNEQLGQLITTLQSRLGQANVDFVLMGRPVYGIGTEALKTIGMSPMLFDLDRMAALTNTYLMALYGNEKWVEGVYGQSLWLNRNLISRKKLSLSGIQRQVAEFIIEFEGIRAAFVAADLPKTPLAGTLSKRHTGDVLFVPENGYRLMENEKTVTDYVVEHNPTSPVYIYSLHHQHLPQRFEATELINLIDQ